MKNKAKKNHSKDAFKYAVINSGTSITALCKQAADLTNISWHTIYGHIVGNIDVSFISKDEITAFSAILNMSEDDILKLLGTKSSSTAKNTPADKTKKTSKKLKTSNKSATKSPSKTNIKEPKKAPAKIVPVDGVLNVFDVFRIINGNMQLILNETQTLPKLDDSEKIIMDAIANLNRRIGSLETKIDKLLASSKTSENIISPLDILPRPEREDDKVGIKSDTVKYDDTPLESICYNPSEDIDAYSQKINAFVRKIARDRNLTMNQVRHEFYDTMKKTYGVVYEQLQKEYFARHGKKSTWSLALLHNDVLFAEIFFNIVKDACLANKKKPA